MIEPLRLDFELRCDAEHAFDVWTRRTSLWWPASHSVSGAAGLLITIEPCVGGRIFERTPDGTEHDWGEVTVWEPPERLGYRWHLRRERADATDVLVTFVPLVAGGCRVTIDHRGWEHLGADGQTWRDANREGWAGLLPHFVTAAEDE
jgi:hypothetical protein